MPTVTPEVWTQYLHASLIALIRAELQGRVPARFTGVGAEIWKTFRNELTLSDLLILAIQDAAINMPIPFDPARWSETPTWSEFQVGADVVQTWLPEAHQRASLSPDAYLQAQAALLNVPVPSAAMLAKLPAPLRHERWLELPGTAGWVAFALCSRPAQKLYLWENFTILCNTPQEMLMAGLIAWELDAPPNLELPILLDDAHLTATIQSGQMFHNVVGKLSDHSQRDLRCLHLENKQPVWL